MNEFATTSTFHVLLVGIDRYPEQYSSLAACVNDIDAVEALLLDQPGIGFPADRIRITRLAAPAPGHISTSRFQHATLPPTKTNLVQALLALASPAVQPEDRVLIFYAGHGDERQWFGNAVWHEALVPHNDIDIEHLFDVEINGLIASIAARTSDLTVVLDCCHSAGATRRLDGADKVAHSAARGLSRADTPVQPPDLTALGIAPPTGQSRGGGTPLLQQPDPDYLVVVACQPHEKANEGALTFTEQSHGVFTYSLLQALAAVAPEQRSQLRWSDIWPALLEQVTLRNANLRQPAQHPWLIGHGARRVFGGAWAPMDTGYTVTSQAGGDYAIGAGHLMGVTAGAQIAVYGDEPRFFPPLGSDADRPVGLLEVTTATAAQARAVVTGPDFALPMGARGRLVRPGASDRLQVALQPEDAGASAVLAASPLLSLVATHSGAEVMVTRHQERWIVGNEIEPVIALAEAGELHALRAGLEQYHRYNTVLRLASRCTAPDLSNALTVSLLDCNDPRAATTLTALASTDPLPTEAPRDVDGVYAVPEGYQFCVYVTNHSNADLLVSLLNCSAAGLVEYLGDRLLRARAAEVIWLDDQVGVPLTAGRDKLPLAPPGMTQPPFATERLVAVGTSRLDVNLQTLTVNERVQEVIDALSGKRGGGQRPMRPASSPASAPAELWTATVTPIRIR